MGYMRKANGMPTYNRPNATSIDNEEGCDLCWVGEHAHKWKRHAHKALTSGAPRRSVLHDICSTPLPPFCIKLTLPICICMYIYIYRNNFQGHTL